MRKVITTPISGLSMQCRARLVRRMGRSNRYLIDTSKPERTYSTIFSPDLLDVLSIKGT